MLPQSHHPARVLGHLLIILLAGLAPLALAGTVAEDTQISDPWIRALPPSSAVTAGYMQLLYPGPDAQSLVAAKSQCAGSIELHEHTMENGVMSMRQVPQVVLKPGVKTTLEPHGLHLMLFDLQCPPDAGTQMDLELEFSDGSKRTLQVPVK